MITQLSVFLENKTGHLMEVTQTLWEAGINIEALSLAETEEYGILRMIVEDPEKAMEALRERDFTVRITQVLCVVTNNVPGALHRVLHFLSDAGIGVAYMYGYANENRAPMIMKVDDPDQAEAILKEHNLI